MCFSNGGGGCVCARVGVCMQGWDCVMRISGHLET